MFLGSRGSAPRTPPSGGPPGALPRAAPAGPSGGSPRAPAAGSRDSRPHKRPEIPGPRTEDPSRNGTTAPLTSIGQLDRHHAGKMMNTATRTVPLNRISPSDEKRRTGAPKTVGRQIKTHSNLQKVRQPHPQNSPTIQPTTKKVMIAVGFEPTPSRTSALSWRLRPLGQATGLTGHSAGRAGP